MTKTSPAVIDYRTSPDRYRHWRLSVSGAVARLELDVDERAGLSRDYELKLNSYDLSVDIELADAVQRLRFEHPSVSAVIITSGKDRVFSAGANIRMLAGASHHGKVNFCKFSNETRNAIEDATAFSGQRYFCALNGAAAGGGYELALATDHIILIDDGSSTVSLPEVPLLGVLPGTGGLTRLIDKRKVQRDRADFFCTVEEGIRGQRALEWKLVDELAPPSRFEELVTKRVTEHTQSCSIPANLTGIELEPIERRIGDDHIAYPHITVSLDRRDVGVATITLSGPDGPALENIDSIHRQGARFWPLALARELEDLILHLRTNEPALGTWIFKSTGNLEQVETFDRCLLADADDWLMREITLYWKRVLKRLEVTSRSLITLIEPGSCYAGFLLEIALGSDRSYMLAGVCEDHDAGPAVIRVSDINLGPLSTVCGISRIHSRYLGDSIQAVLDARGQDLTAAAAQALRLVTFIPDDLDWDDEVRLALEARAGFSPDALTGMEASLRFPGPETMESRIFARLSAWQNWIFQRPNAVGENGALARYGTGLRSEFDRHRV